MTDAPALTAETLVDRWRAGSPPALADADRLIAQFAGLLSESERRELYGLALAQAVAADTDLYHRWDAVSLIGALGARDRDAVGVLVEVLITGAPFLRANAAWALGEIAPGTALPPLGRTTLTHQLGVAADDLSQFARYWAKRALTALNRQTPIGPHAWAIDEESTPVPPQAPGVTAPYRRFLRLIGTGVVQVHQGDFGRRDLGITPKLRQCAPLDAFESLAAPPETRRALGPFATGVLNGLDLALLAPSLAHYHYGNRKGRFITETWPAEGLWQVPWLQVYPVPPGWATSPTASTVCPPFFGALDAALLAEQAGSALEAPRRARLADLVVIGHAKAGVLIALDAARLAPEVDEPLLSVYRLADDTLGELGLTFTAWINDPTNLLAALDKPARDKPEDAPAPAADRAP